jgi:NAD(P)-dependent dehydrogenase (short-subunit alcohol dehydrogenase family)
LLAWRRPRQRDLRAIDALADRVSRMNRLVEKVVLVMGSTMGIGRAIATAVAAEGAAVVVTGRTEEKGQAVVAEIGATGGDAMYVRVDVTEPPTVEAAVRATVERFGRIDGIVNNVANMALARVDRPVTELALEDWNLIIASDLTSAFLGMKYGIRAMLEGGRGGAVLNIASEAGLRGMNGVDGYTASKGAIIALTRSVASYYARYDVRCNTLAVGFVDTGGDRIRELLGDATFAREIQGHHLGHIGQPEEIASVAVFMLSDEAAYISGVTLPVDAGATAAAHIVRPSAPDIAQFPRLRPHAPLC